MKYYFACFLLTSLSACSYFKKQGPVDPDVIARVKDDYLYLADVSAFTRGKTGQDSIDILKSYAESWIKKKLLLEKAKENIPDDDLAIVKKIEDYKEALILYEYEKALINRRLDTIVSADELSKWYEQMKDNFPLAKDIYAAQFIKLNKNTPEIDKARKWILKPKSEEEVQQLEGYCREFAPLYNIDKTVWYETDQMLTNFPLKEADIRNLSTSKNFKEYKSGDELWFIKITEMLSKEKPSPIELVSDKLAKAVIEKRRIKLLEKMYDKIYQDGVESKSFEITVK